MKQLLCLAWVALLSVGLSAQTNSVVASLKTTSGSATSVCVGCTTGGTTAAANSGLKAATISIESLAAPSVTTNKLYNVSGALTWNGTTLATGSTISGTTNTIGLFTGVAAMGNSLLTQSGSTVTMAGTLAATLHSGSGASLTNIPTSAVSSGSFVATVASGTGITSSVTTGNAAATTISLNNTAVTPGAYGGATTFTNFTVDQQGRLTAASTSAAAAMLGVANTFTATEQTLAVSANAATSWRIINTSAGAGAMADIRMDNDVGTTRLTLRSYSSGWATSLPDVADSVLLRSGGAGGLTLNALHASGVIRFVLGTTQRAQYDAVGNYSFGSTGNVTDSIATPTLSSCDAGSLNSITGKAYAMRISINGSLFLPTTCTINFGATFANAPACIATRGTAGAADGIGISTSTTQVVLTAGSDFIDNEVVHVQCRGF